MVDLLRFFLQKPVQKNPSFAQCQCAYKKCQCACRCMHWRGDLRKQSLDFKKWCHDNPSIRDVEQKTPHKRTPLLMLSLSIEFKLMIHCLMTLMSKNKQTPFPKQQCFSTSVGTISGTQTPAAQHRDQSTTQQQWEAPKHALSILLVFVVLHPGLPAQK